jgi:iron complex transport system substrate-binding protein
VAPVRRLLPLLAALAVAACGSPAPPPDATQAAFPATVTHRYGQTVVPAAPKRVVTVGPGDADAVLAMGTVPVAVREGPGPWAHDRLKGQQPQVLPDLAPEAVAALRPDLVVAVTAGLTREQYDAYARIAPTVAGPDAEGSVPWPEATRLTGAALGRPERADMAVADLEERFVEAEEDNPDLAGATVAAARPGPDPASFAVWTSTDARGRFFTALGMRVPARFDQLAGDAPVATLGVDRLAALDDADVLVVLGTAEERAAFAALPGYGDLRAVRDGKVVTLDDVQSAALAAGSVLSLRAALETVPARLSAALQ